MGICSNEVIGGFALAGTFIATGAYSAVSLPKAVGAKLTAATVCDCFCNVMSNISETVCHQAFDRAYGVGLYPPFDVKLFCGSEGGCHLLKSSAGWGLAFPSLATCAAVISFAALGVCMYKYHNKKNQGYTAINDVTS